MTHKHGWPSAERSKARVAKGSIAHELDRRIVSAKGIVPAFATAVLTAFLAFTPPVPASATPSENTKPLLFGTNEIRSDRLEKFRKWTGVMERYEKEQPRELKACKPTRADPCHIARWRVFLKKIADRPVLDQVRLVNKAMNKWTYILDPINYGVEDYWATPAQFMYRNGDCEDYAITKYLSLRHLGFPVDRMRIVVLQDLNLGIPHAILVVYLNGKALVLDNQVSQVIEASRIKHYKPIYSINHDAWWLHRG